MSAMRQSITDVLAAHRRIALDSNVLIYLFEGSTGEADAATAIVDAVETGLVQASMATVGITEVLTRPAVLGEAVLFEQYADELTSLPNLRLVTLTAELAADAAWARGHGHRDLPDAVHLASARAAGATAFVTNDRRIRSHPGLEIVYLSDLVVEAPPA